MPDTATLIALAEQLAKQKRAQQDQVNIDPYAGLVAQIQNLTAPATGTDPSYTGSFNRLATSDPAPDPRSAPQTVDERGFRIPAVSAPFQAVTGSPMTIDPTPQPVAPQLPAAPTPPTGIEDLLTSTQDAATRDSAGYQVPSAPTPFSATVPAADMSNIGASGVAAMAPQAAPDALAQMQAQLLAADQPYHAPSWLKYGALAALVAGLVTRGGARETVKRGIGGLAQAAFNDVGQQSQDQAAHKALLAKAIDFELQRQQQTATLDFHSQQLAIQQEAAKRSVDAATWKHATDRANFIVSEANHQASTSGREVHMVYTPDGLPFSYYLGANTTAENRAVNRDYNDSLQVQMAMADAQRKAAAFQTPEEKALTEEQVFHQHMVEMFGYQTNLDRLTVARMDHEYQLKRALEQGGVDIYRQKEGIRVGSSEAIHANVVAHPAGRGGGGGTGKPEKPKTASQRDDTRAEAIAIQAETAYNNAIDGGNHPQAAAHARELVIDNAFKKGASEAAGVKRHLLELYPHYHRKEE